MPRTYRNLLLSPSANKTSSISKKRNKCNTTMSFQIIDNPFLYKSLILIQMLSIKANKLESSSHPVIYLNNS